MDFKIIQRKKIWYLISGVLFIASILSIAILKLNLGIDFTGGSALEISLSDSANIENVNISDTSDFAKYLNQNISTSATGAITVQKSSNGYILRFKEISQNDKETLINSIKEKVDPEMKEVSFEAIGPVLGNELKKKTIKAIAISLIAIILYVAYAFRKSSYPVKSWKYGVVAIVGLAFNITVTVGIFTILSKVLNIEIDSLFITALLTILGYAINDTIVTYDRIRENVQRRNGNFDDIVNTSINETMTRTINTTVTTLFSLLAVFFFGGESIRMFALALIIGITLGTYSSIFIASPLLTTIYNIENKKKSK